MIVIYVVLIVIRLTKDIIKWILKLQKFLLIKFYNRMLPLLIILIVETVLDVLLNL